MSAGVSDAAGRYVTPAAIGQWRTAEILRGAGCHGRPACQREPRAPNRRQPPVLPVSPGRWRQEQPGDGNVLTNAARAERGGRGAELQRRPPSLQEGPFLQKAPAAGRLAHLRVPVSGDTPGTFAHQAILALVIHDKPQTRQQSCRNH